jgi:hypothetical protein
MSVGPVASLPLAAFARAVSRAAARLVAFGHVLAEAQIDGAVDGDVVGIIKRHELVEFEMARKGTGFARHTFHHAAVAQDDVGEVIDDRVRRAIEP